MRKAYKKVTGTLAIIAAAIAFAALFFDIFPVCVISTVTAIVLMGISA